MGVGRKIFHPQKHWLWCRCLTGGGLVTYGWANQPWVGEMIKLIPPRPHPGFYIEMSPRAWAVLFADMEMKRLDVMRNGYVVTDDMTLKEFLMGLSKYESMALKPHYDALCRQDNLAPRP